MLQPFPLFIGWRYTRAKAENKFVSIISGFSMLGIMIGVMALIVILSVMNGFEKEMRERILGMVSHVTVSSLDDGFSDWQKMQKKLNKVPRVLASAPYTEGQVMLVNGKKVTGVQIRGILPATEKDVSKIANNISIGELEYLKENRFGIILGTNLARYLKAEIGQKITLITPQVNVTIAGVVPRLKRFKVVGIFDVGMYEYDRNMALVHLSDAGKLFGIKKDAAGGLRFKIDDMFASWRVRSDMREVVGKGYWISDWTLKHKNYFRAVATEKTVMFVILGLIVFVAAFNIVSTLVIIVTEKQSDIAILRTLGASPANIMQIFLTQGLTIGIIGTLLGVGSGVLLAANIETIVPAIESLFNVEFLAADLYYISDVPSDLRLFDVFKIGTMSIMLSLLATIFPAFKAAKTNPATALRSE
ncbi:MAG: lipoprotein-releasing ABC transporter permease subunit [Gammaproteobacteria bacterium]|nr:MAG: lipoprotein-releasing ABC transporter permease subunit [Gammaproteobacteria bacterium]